MNNSEGVRKRMAEQADTGLSAWHGLLRTNAALIEALNEDLSKEHGISFSSYLALDALASAPKRKLRMSELAEAMLLSRSGATRLVDRLASDGLIARDRDIAEDRRGCFATLTARGRRVESIARATYRDGLNRRFVVRFTPDELDTFAGAWERIKARPVEVEA